MENSFKILKMSAVEIIKMSYKLNSKIVCLEVDCLIKTDGRYRFSFWVHFRLSAESAAHRDNGLGERTKREEEGDAF